jgi:hypothetical protein
MNAPLKATPAVLAQRAEDLSKRILILDAEYNAAVLAAAEGDEKAGKQLPTMEAERVELAAAMRRVRDAQRLSQERDNAEAAARATAEAQKQEAERKARTRKKVRGIEADVVALDKAVAEARRLILKIAADGEKLVAEINVTAKTDSFHTTMGTDALVEFRRKIPILIEAALSVGPCMGRFKAGPFVYRDAEGLPDLSACSLAPYFPADYLLQLAKAADQDKAA